MSAVEKFRIMGENIYNFDKKGFLIGVGVTSVRVITHEVLRSGEIIGARRDCNREWVSILTAICAVASTILSPLMYVM